MVKIVATQDVDRRALRVLSSSLQTEFETEVNEVEIGLRSAEPPSWIVLLADADWWIKGLGAYAALYIAELVKEAGKSTWKNLAGRQTPSKNSKLEKLAEELAALKIQIADRTKLSVGLPFPDDYFSTHLNLSGTDAASIAVEIGLFLHHLPKLEELIAEENLTEDTVATGIFLKLSSDSSLEVLWFDADTSREETRYIYL